jgi:hypothetical protein
MQGFICDVLSSKRFPITSCLSSCVACISGTSHYKLCCVSSVERSMLMRECRLEAL